MNAILKKLTVFGAVFVMTVSFSSQLWQTICRKCGFIDEPHTLEHTEPLIDFGSNPIHISGSTVSTTGYIKLVDLVNRSSR